MGTDKAVQRLGGRRLIDHVVAALHDASLEVVIAGPPRPDVDAAAVADPPALAGPAAGLVGVMRAYPGCDVVLVGTDQPFLRAATIQGLLAIEGPLVAPIDGRRQTLCAVYRSAAAPAVERLVAGTPSPSLQPLFDADGIDVPENIWRGWGEDGRSWLSLDTPAALAAAAATWPEAPDGTIRR